MISLRSPLLMALFLLPILAPAAETPVPEDLPPAAQRDWQRFVDQRDRLIERYREQLRSLRQDAQRDLQRVRERFDGEDESEREARAAIDAAIAAVDQAPQTHDMLGNPVADPDTEALYQDGLQIIAARYGMGEHWVDVTEEARAAVEDHRLRMRADNAIAGDPLEGVRKKLEVTYRLDGEERQASAWEGEHVVIERPEDPGRDF